MGIKKMAVPWSLLGNLAVLGGIILVAVEIRQNSRLVEAQMESDDNAAWVAIDA